MCVRSIAEEEGEGKGERNTRYGEVTCLAYFLTIVCYGPRSKTKQKTGQGNTQDLSFSP